MAADVDLGTIFLATILLAFALTLLVSGLLGAYFGKGKSRSVGFVLAIVALLLGGLFAALTWPLVPGLEPRFDPDLVGQGLLAVVAATAGSLLAIGLFIASVMRS